MDLEIEKIMVIAGRSGAAGYALGGDILGRYREAVGGGGAVGCMSKP